MRLLLFILILVLASLCDATPFSKEIPERSEPSTLGFTNQDTDISSVPKGEGATKRDVDIDLSRSGLTVPNSFTQALHFYSNSITYLKSLLLWSSSKLRSMTVAFVDGDIKWIYKIFFWLPVSWLRFSPVDIVSYAILHFKLMLPILCPLLDRIPAIGHPMQKFIWISSNESIQSSSTIPVTPFWDLLFHVSSHLQTNVPFVLSICFAFNVHFALWIVDSIYSMMPSSFERIYGNIIPMPIKAPLSIFVFASTYFGLRYFFVAGQFFERLFFRITGPECLNFCIGTTAFIEVLVISAEDWLLIPSLNIIANLISKLVSQAWVYILFAKNKLCKCFAENFPEVYFVLKWTYRIFYPIVTSLSYFIVKMFTNPVSIIVDAGRYVVDAGRYGLEWAKNTTSDAAKYGLEWAKNTTSDAAKYGLELAKNTTRGVVARVENKTLEATKALKATLAPPPPPPETQRALDAQASLVSGSPKTALLPPNGKLPEPKVVLFQLPSITNGSTDSSSSKKDPKKSLLLNRPHAAAAA